MRSTVHGRRQQGPGARADFEVSGGDHDHRVYGPHWAGLKSFAAPPRYPERHVHRAPHATADLAVIGAGPAGTRAGAPDARRASASCSSTPIRCAPGHRRWSLADELPDWLSPEALPLAARPSRPAAAAAVLPSLRGARQHPSSGRAVVVGGDDSHRPRQWHADARRVTLSDGSTLTADVVVDASGRRAPGTPPPRASAPMASSAT